MSKAQNTQYMVLWSIVGPIALVLGLFVLSAALLAVAASNSDSWAAGVGAVLYYCSRFGAVLVAPVVALFSLLGLAVLPNKQIKRKALTLAVCAAGVVASVAVVAGIFLGRQ